MAYVKRNNAIDDKSFYFGCDIVNFSRELKKIHEFEIASQLIRCGTSIDANIRE